MEDANCEQVSPEETLGEELGADTMAVEEARKRIRAQLDAGEDPLSATADREGHDVIERLHLRPAAKASRATPEERILATEPSSRRQGATTFWKCDEGQPGCTGRTLITQSTRPGDRPGKKALGKKVFLLILFVSLWRTIALD
eukprot:1879719-Amphidinium_carterae.1